MASTTTNETRIEADPKVPTMTITREFDHPVERVFRAWTDPDLFARWIGPRGVETEVERWDASTGGGYRYSTTHEGIPQGFYGSFHEVRPNERIVQTFTWDGEPDGVSLETMTFEALDGGRTRIIGVSLVDSMEARDQMMASGMDVGIREGYEKLDELLAG